ncbi:MAG: hypothetical protein H8E37_01700 [Planctomycetes bacterium]|nr:hypothetical protein [Planctomycetota bacterium]
MTIRRCSTNVRKPGITRVVSDLRTAPGVPKASVVSVRSVVRPGTGASRMPGERVLTGGSLVRVVGTGK